MDRRVFLKTALAGSAVVGAGLGGRAAASGEVRSLSAGASHLALGPGVRGVRFRASGRWTRWQAAQSCSAGDDAGRVARGSLVAMPGDASAYEVEGPSGGTGEVVARAPGGTARSTQDSFVLGQKQVPCTYLSRREWGADESLRFGPDGAEAYPQTFHPVQALTVHHSAIAVGPDPAADLRAIYRFHTVNQDFGDVGYHLLIDPLGTVYEGRVSGGDAGPVFGPGRDERNRLLMSNAAHVGGHNAGNVGVCLMGDFTSAGPGDAARRSLVLVLAALCEVTGVDPLGEVDYVNPIGGAAKRVRGISGHQDWMATGCPGKTFYPALDEVRRQVAAALA
ncbi:peptidoglycan recognition family protein [Lentzea sp. NPDC060358]|uniref:peptidoglycan recognition protein family protein n=1 Tax=Lentzea sp. NPDC060358 TaxID=3347103 RepID=UPI0036600E7C